MRTPRIAVVGAGANIWPFHDRAIRAAGLKVVAVQDVVGERAEMVGAQLGCPATDSLDTLLAVESDAVAILAPHREHHALAKAALAARRHVLVEKPVTVTVDEARDLVAAAKTAGRILAVCFQQRTRTELAEARRLVRAGALGELQRVDLLATWPRPQAYFHTAPWRASWRGEGGGILINQGQHDLDALCFVAGAPRYVHAVTRTAVHRIETEDTAAALLQWTDGALGSVHLSSAELDLKSRLEITGTRGRLCVRPGRLDVVRNDVDFRVYARTATDPYAPPAATAEPTLIGTGGRHEEIYANFRDALLGKADPVATGDSAIAPLELAAAITISGYERMPVELPLPAGRHTAVLEALTPPARR
jgi:predicted dehydrogenase